MAQLGIGFILARRFTLSAFSTFVDVLRLAADEGDRSRPIHCRWRVLSTAMEPIPSSCGVVVQPEERAGDPRAFDYLVVVGGLVDETERLDPGSRPICAGPRRPACRWSGSAPGPSSCTAPG